MGQFCDIKRKILIFLAMLYQPLKQQYQLQQTHSDLFFLFLNFLSQ